MKKILAMLLTCALILSMTACGGAASSPASGSAPASVSAKPKPTEGDASPETVAALDAYNAMVDAYNAVNEKISADPTLSAMTEITTITDEFTAQLNEVTDIIDITDDLTPEQITALNAVIDGGNAVTKELDALLGASGGTAKK